MTSWLELNVSDDDSLYSSESNEKFDYDYNIDRSSPPKDTSQPTEGTPTDIPSVDANPISIEIPIQNLSISPQTNPEPKLESVDFVHESCSNNSTNHVASVSQKRVFKVNKSMPSAPSPPPPMTHLTHAQSFPTYNQVKIPSHSLNSPHLRPATPDFSRYKLPLPEHAPFCMWMGNLPVEARTGDIYHYLALCSLVPKDVRFGRVIRGKHTCAFVDFHTLSDLKKALTCIDCQTAPRLMGRRVSVDIGEGKHREREHNGNMNGNMHMNGNRNDNSMNNEHQLHNQNAPRHVQDVRKSGFSVAQRPNVHSTLNHRTGQFEHYRPKNAKIGHNKQNNQNPQSAIIDVGPAFTDNIASPNNQKPVRILKRPPQEDDIPPRRRKAAEQKLKQKEVAVNTKVVVPKIKQREAPPKAVQKPEAKQATKPAPTSKAKPAGDDVARPQSPPVIQELLNGMKTAQQQQKGKKRRQSAGDHADQRQRKGRGDRRGNRYDDAVYDAPYQKRKNNYKGKRYKNSHRADREHYGRDNRNHNRNGYYRDDGGGYGYDQDYGNGRNHHGGGGGYRKKRHYDGY